MPYDLLLGNRKLTHPQKFNKRAHLLVHDPASSLREGDIISITPGFRVSKHVHHVVSSIVAPFGEPIEARPAVPTAEERLLQRAQKLDAKREMRLGKLSPEDREKKLALETQLVEVEKRKGKLEERREEKAKEIRQVRERENMTREQLAAVEEAKAVKQAKIDLWLARPLEEREAILRKQKEEKAAAWLALSDAEREEIEMRRVKKLEKKPEKGLEEEIERQAESELWHALTPAEKEEKMRVDKERKEAKLLALPVVERVVVEKKRQEREAYKAKNRQALREKWLAKPPRDEVEREAQEKERERDSESKEAVQTEGSATGVTDEPANLAVGEKEVEKGAEKPTEKVAEKKKSLWNGGGFF